MHRKTTQQQKVHVVTETRECFDATDGALEVQFHLVSSFPCELKLSTICCGKTEDGSTLGIEHSFLRCWAL